MSVEDLVPNDVLVVKERQAMETHHTRYYPPEGPRSRQPDDGRGQSASLRRPEEMHHQQMPVATVARTRLQSLLPPPGAPLLTHFIKANHYGYYFLAEIESARVGGRDGGREGGREGRAEEGSLKKRTHCVVKVPSCDKSSGELGREGGERRREVGRREGGRWGGRRRREGGVFSYAYETAYTCTVKCCHCSILQRNRPQQVI